MKKLLILFVALFSLVGTMPGNAASQRTAPTREHKTKRSIMELPLFERAVLIIKKFETLHKPKHWPYVGYGHQVQPGEPYRRGCQLTETQADALLRKDYSKFCALYEKYGKDKYLLAALAYNCGPGVVQKSTVLKKLKSGDRNIHASYASHCCYHGKKHKGLLTRRLTELTALFIP